MHLFEGKTADGVWLAALRALLERTPRQSSRLGPTREVLHAAFTIEDPRQRWVASRAPALNPAFALAELIWILNGHQDSAFLNFWNKQLPRFAGVGDTYTGAYGYRLRNWFGVDQLARAAAALVSNPNSRQVVLQIWDPKVDLPLANGDPAHADVPCNTTALIKLRDGKLEWLQVVRSNDMFLGVPYNFVQFTTVQEILAGWIGAELGTYTQVSDSLHLYEHDMGDFSINEPIDLPSNDGSVAYARATSEAALRELDVRARALVIPQISEAELVEVVTAFHGPDEFQNWLRVLGAEAARKRGWLSVAQQLAESSSNPLLRSLWLHWDARLKASQQHEPFHDRDETDSP